MKKEISVNGTAFFQYDRDSEEAIILNHLIGNDNGIVYTKEKIDEVISLGLCHGYKIIIK